MNKIIISNGHFNFFLGELAQNLDKEDMLDRFIMAGYPKTTLLNLIKKTNLKNDASSRLVDRRKKISDSLVYSPWISEVIMQISQRLRNKKYFSRLCEWLDILSLLSYSYSSARCIKNTKAKIYHYRSGYGLISAKLAKKRGMILICDHSIAHPETVDYLINNNGKFPGSFDKNEVSKFWKLVKKDIDIADYVIVNSDFVKSSFIKQGFDKNKIFVVYSGVDKNLISKFKTIKETQFRYKSEVSKPIKFLFCGKFEKRKGSDILLKTLMMYPNKNVYLEIVGVPNEHLRDVKNQVSSFPNIKVIGFINKELLIYKMASSDVFIFPSLCEGSARVIFQAMLSECYIIATPNSGSIVQNNVNGSLIKPGCCESLMDEMKYVENMPHVEISKIGKRNSNEIIQNYNEKTYYKSIKEVYKSIQASNIPK